MASLTTRGERALRVACMGGGGGARRHNNRFK